MILLAKGKTFKIAADVAIGKDAASFFLKGLKILIASGEMGEYELLSIGLLGDGSSLFCCEVVVFDS